MRTLLEIALNHHEINFLIDNSTMTFSLKSEYNNKYINLFIKI